MSTFRNTIRSGLAWDGRRVSSPWPSWPPTCSTGATPSSSYCAFLALRLQPVAHSWFVDDVARVRRVIAQLLADLGHDVSRVVLVSDRVFAPHLSQQRGVRHRFPRMQREKAQQLVLGGSQPHGFSIDLDR